MVEWIVQPLSKSHDRAAFTCGKALLDSFLHSHATQYEKRGLARTYIATKHGSTAVAGYYTLAAGKLDVSQLPERIRRKLPKHEVPTIHLARLAVDNRYQGQGLGEALLLNALLAAVESSEKVGVFGVDVWAIDDEASTFYRKYGFVPLDDSPQHLLLPMKTMNAALA